MIEKGGWWLWGGGGDGDASNANDDDDDDCSNGTGYDRGACVIRMIISTMEKFEDFFEDSYVEDDQGGWIVNIKNDHPRSEDIDNSSVDNDYEWW